MRQRATPGRRDEHDEEAAGLGRPTEVLLEQAIATKAALGLLALRDRLLRRQVESLASMGDESFATPEGGENVLALTKRARFIDDLRADIEKNERRISRAEARLHALCLASSRALAEGTGAAAVKYEALLDEADPDGGEAAARAPSARPPTAGSSRSARR